MSSKRLFRRRRWLRGALVLAAVACFGLPASADAFYMGQRTLHIGMRGTDVSALQGYLDAAGYSIGSGGYYGPYTAMRVRQFEKDHRQRINGVFERYQAASVRAAATVKATYGGLSATRTPTAPVVTPLVAGERARLLSNGLAAAPASAPASVKGVIAAANQIAKTPYKWGGGHPSFRDTGYDCSGSTAYAMHGGRLTPGTAPFFGYSRYGLPGAGHWITLIMNSGHIYMVVAGLRFDTSGLSTSGSRWQTAMRPTTGWIVRHPPGL